MNPMFRFVLTALATLAMFPAISHAATKDQLVAYRMVDIPHREHGYGTVKPTVLTSDAERTAFLKAAKAKGGWNGYDAFHNSLTNTKIMWDCQAIVLLPHWEGSGSIQVKARPPLLGNDILTVPVSRSQPGMGTSDMAYYLFGVVVDKQQVKQVILAPDRRDPVTVKIP